MSCDANRGRWQLLLACAAIVVIWTFVLPKIGARPEVRTKIEQLVDLGIDPAALYYTDVEAMARIERDVAEIMQHHSSAFWRIDGHIGEN